jgi:hypothetical protein
MSKNQDIYWNSILETLPQERLQALQLKKFKRIVAWAYNNIEVHPHSSLPRYEVKGKRFKDRRKAGG